MIEYKRPERKQWIELKALFKVRPSDFELFHFRIDGEIYTDYEGCSKALMWEKLGND